MGVTTEYVINEEDSGPDAPQQTPNVSRPENIPEKFWDAEKGTPRVDELVASYVALEKKLGSSGDKSQETEPKETATTSANEGDVDKAAENVIEQAQLDIGAIEAHWLEHGSIPEKELEKIIKFGVPKEMAEDYARYRMEQAETIREELVNDAGGEEHLVRMKQWAVKEWDASKLAAYNAAIDSGDLGRTQLALQALRSDYEKVHGRNSKFLNVANSGSSPSSDAYQSLAQLLKDQADPRYKSDPAFRQTVMNKLARSNI